MSSAGFATCNGQPIVSGSLLFPVYGMWGADLSIATAAALTAAVIIVIGNLTLTGYVYRSQSFAGQTSARIVAGFGGWAKEIAAKQYTLAQGVRLGMIVRDAALECGEKIGSFSDLVVGTGYVRERAKASRLLRQLTSLGHIPNWYIDPTGATQLQAWPTTTIRTPFEVPSQKPDRGVVEIATEDYASWMPGSTFSASNLSGTFTNGGAQYTFTNEGKARLEILTAP